MLKKWFSIFKKDTLMEKAYQKSYQMFDITRDMFSKAKESLRNLEKSEIYIDIYNKDIKVNRFQRRVRRNIFSHLAICGPEKLPAGLVLLIIINDLERIGDYTKNIVELAQNYPSKLYGFIYEKDLQRIEQAIEDSLIQTKLCFESGDGNMALKLLKEYEWINPVCDKDLMGLVKEEDKSIKPGDSASLALYFRCLKRINSHLNNITSSTANPFDRIGYKPKYRNSI